MDKAQKLSEYLPEGAACIIARWIDEYKCDFRIAGKRSSKLGDYRPRHKGLNHRISVNYNLNPYGFLITTVHEFAHLLTWNEYKSSVKPHGQEWKRNFKKMMQPFLEMEIFPQHLKNEINSYLINPSASSCTDINLFRAIQEYNAPDPGGLKVLLIENIPCDTTFMVRNGRKFKKLEKMRKRYKCIELATGRLYLFHPMAEIFEAS